MNGASSAELIGNGVGILIAGLIAVWVGLDAKKHGLKNSTAVGWGIGVFFLLIVFLPLYLWSRRKASPAGAAPTSAAPIAGVPCRYCGYENAGNPDYCGKCGRQMRSSTEIHR